MSCINVLLHISDKPGIFCVNWYCVKEIQYKLNPEVLFNLFDLKSPKSHTWNKKLNITIISIFEKKWDSCDDEKNYQNISFNALRKLTYCKNSNACACDVIDSLLFSLVYFCMTTVIRMVQYDHWIQRLFLLISF